MDDPDDEEAGRWRELRWKLVGQFNIPRRLSAWFRARCGLGGDFKQGEISARAAELTTRWHERWPGWPPLLPGEIPSSSREGDRWVRFHSLPESKRWPETDDERLEILHRHLTVLRELIAKFGCAELVVVLLDWNAYDIYGGWTKKQVPGAWPWTRWRDPREDADDPFVYYWGAPLLRSANSTTSCSASPTTLGER